MKSVIHIPENNTENNEPVEFTYMLIGEKNNWLETNKVKPNMYSKIVYLGKSYALGDMFACYTSSPFAEIEIFRGHLNSGKY